MKSIKIYLFFLSSFLHGSQYSSLKEQEFRNSLRSYDPSKDVGLQQGQSYAFGHHGPVPKIPKKPTKVLVLPREKLSHFSRRPKTAKSLVPPFIPSLRLRWSEAPKSENFRR